MKWIAITLVVSMFISAIIGYITERIEHKMNITPVKIFYIEPDKLYAYMVGVVTIYSKYPQITPEIREQIEMDIAETIPDIAYDYHYTNGEFLPPINQKIYGMSTQQYTLTYIANRILEELTPN